MDDLHVRLLEANEAAQAIDSPRSFVLPRPGIDDDGAGAREATKRWLSDHRPSRAQATWRSPDDPHAVTVATRGVWAFNPDRLTTRVWSPVDLTNLSRDAGLVREDRRTKYDVARCVTVFVEGLTAQS